MISRSKATTTKIDELIDFHVRLVVISICSVLANQAAKDCNGEFHYDAREFIRNFNANIPLVIKSCQKAYWRGSISPYLYGQRCSASDSGYSTRSEEMVGIQNALSRFKEAMRKTLYPCYALTYTLSSQGRNTFDVPLDHVLCSIGALCDYVLLQNQVPSNDTIITAGWDHVSKVIEACTMREGDSKLSLVRECNYANLYLVPPNMLFTHMNHNIGSNIIWYLSTLDDIPFSCHRYMVLNAFDDPMPFCGGNFVMHHQGGACDIKQVMASLIKKNSHDLYATLSHFSLFNVGNPLLKFTSYKKLPALIDPYGNRSDVAPMIPMSLQYLDTLSPYMPVLINTHNTYVVVNIDLDRISHAAALSQFSRFIKMFVSEFPFDEAKPPNLMVIVNHHQGHDRSIDGTNALFALLYQLGTVLLSGDYQEQQQSKFWGEFLVTFYLNPVWSADKSFYIPALDDVFFIGGNLAIKNIYAESDAVTVSTNAHKVLTCEDVQPEHVMGGSEEWCFMVNPSKTTQKQWSRAVVKYAKLAFDMMQFRNGDYHPEHAVALHCPIDHTNRHSITYLLTGCRPY